MHRRPQFEPLARLAADGCGLFGPWGSRWVGLSCRTRTPGPLVLRGCVYPAGCCCGGLAAGARLGGCAAGDWAGCLGFVSRGCVCPAWCCCGGLAAGARLGGCAAGVWSGCLAFVSRGCVYPAGCCCGGFAAGARLGGCAAGAWAGCLAFVSRGCVCPAGCCCGGYAAGARLGWLCRLGLGWVLGLRLAWVRLPCRVLLRRLWPPGRVWVAVPLEFGLGAWACDWRGCVEDTPDIDVRFPS